MVDKREAGKTRKPRPSPPPAREFTLSNLEQIRILADPLRLRILETLCEERTTKQVAQLIDEKPTKLYHHVDALERVGLIRLTRTRRNRGTLEKYYQAVARAFRADSRLFSQTAAPTGAHPIDKAITTLLERTGSELRQLMAEPGGASDLEVEGTLTFVEIRAGEEQILGIKRGIDRLLHQLQKTDCNGRDRTKKRRFRLTLAFFPLDKTSRRPR